MITIDLGTIETFDSSTSTFGEEKGGIVRFEYSLKVLYEWESKWRKPFLKGGLTGEESFDFYKMMALDPFDDKFLTADVIKTLADYIANADTATTFTSHENGKSGKKSSKGKLFTAEELYALMFSAGVPIEFENRNLNRLLIILKIIDSFNEEPKRMSKTDILKQNRELNAQRKAQLKTRG